MSEHVRRLRGVSPFPSLLMKPSRPVVLVFDPDPMVGLVAADVLEEMGCDVVGPFSDLDDAIAAASVCDAAIVRSDGPEARTRIEAALSMDRVERRQHLQ